jgi:hypothetical protein
MVARALEIFCPGSLMGLVEKTSRIFSDGFPVDRSELRQHSRGSIVLWPPEKHST